MLMIERQGDELELYKLLCSDVEFTEELLSSETESSTKSLVGESRPDE